MAITKQHEYYERRLEELLKEMPDFINEYVEAKMDNRSPLTLFNYVRDYKEFLSWLMADERVKWSSLKTFPVSLLGSLPLSDAQDYFKYVSRKKYEKANESYKISSKTVNRHKSSLRSLFNYLTIEAEVSGTQGEPYFHRNVMKKIPIKKVSETFNERARKISEKIFIGNEDLNFLEYIKNEYENTLSPSELKFFNRDKERNFAIISLFLGSGIRVNELIELRLKDIDSKNNEISIIRKGGKKDTIPVTPSSMLDVLDYLSIRNERYKAGNEESQYLFVKQYKGDTLPLTARAVENIVYKYTKSFDKRMAPHKLRHTYATNLAEQTGGDIPLIMNQLGHTQSDISLLYINTSREKAKLAAERLDQRRNK